MRLYQLVREAEMVGEDTYLINTLGVFTSRAAAEARIPLFQALYPQWKLAHPGYTEPTYDIEEFEEGFTYWRDGFFTPEGLP